MQLDQPEVFVYFLPNRRLFFPTDERTPSLTFALQSNFAGEGMGKSNPFIATFLKTPE